MSIKESTQLSARELRVIAFGAELAQAELVLANLDAEMRRAAWARSATREYGC